MKIKTKQTNLQLLNSSGQRVNISCNNCWQISQPPDRKIPECWRVPLHALGLWCQNHFWGPSPPLELGHWMAHDPLPSHRPSFWWPAKHWTQFMLRQTSTLPSALMRTFYFLLSTLPQAQKLCKSIRGLRETANFKNATSTKNLLRAVYQKGQSRALLCQKKADLWNWFTSDRSHFWNIHLLRSLASASSHFVLLNHKTQIIQSNQSRLLTKLKNPN